MFWIVGFALATAGFLWERKKRFEAEVFNRHMEEVKEHVLVDVSLDLAEDIDWPHPLRYQKLIRPEPSSETERFKFDHDWWTYD